MSQTAAALPNKPPAPARIGFRTLIDPMSPEDFLDDVFNEKAVYLPGQDNRFDDVFSWDGVSRLLDMSTLWSSATLKMVLDGRSLEAEEFCSPNQNRDGASVAQPDPARVQALIRQGATVSLNLVETMTPEISSIVAALQCWFTGETVCNVYCSAGGHQGFGSHFDIHDVFVLQIAGTKTWNIYAGHFEESVNLEGYRSNSFSDEFNNENRGPIDMQPTMTPGDVLYIPRGRYHDALASSDASLHLTFGVEFMSGFHFLSAIGTGLIEDPVLRKPLPRFDDGDAHREHMREMADHVHAYMTNPMLSQVMRKEQRKRAFSYCLQTYNMPTGKMAPVLRVRSLRKRLARQGAEWRLETPSGATDLSAEEARLAEWLFPQDYFLAEEAEAAFGTGLPVATILGKFERIGLVESI
ncbi:MAG: cupin domain-containing protein [Pseudomonadota bacterium]